MAYYRCEQRPANVAQHLEASQLRLDRDTGIADRIDQRATVVQHRHPGPLHGQDVRVVANALDGGWPQAHRIGVEAEHDLRLALGDQRGEPVAEIVGRLACARRASRETGAWSRWTRRRGHDT